MGKSDPYLRSFYTQRIIPKGDVALLGFTNNNWFDGDLYDPQLDNWNINSEWELGRKYYTIISLRCPYFAKDPVDFVDRCHNHLNDGGRMFLEWGLGDHWRFDNYKIGWVKDGEQEYAYQPENYLWSTIWDESFKEQKAYQQFQQNVAKQCYYNVEQAINDEVPSVLQLEHLKKNFETACTLLTLWPNNPQLYILVGGLKK